MNLFQKILGSRPPKARAETAIKGPLGWQFASLHGQGQRKDQQDAFVAVNVKDAEAVERSGMLALVADGMGGMADGALAAETAAACVANLFERFNGEFDIGSQLNLAALEANRQVYELLAGRGGSTLAACVIYRDKLSFVSVGDSGIYLLREGQLSRLNREQNLLNSMLLQHIREGRAQPDELDPEINKAALTHCIGMATLDETDRLLRPLPMQRGDVLLICSDGVDGTVDDEGLAECMSLPKAEDICAALDKRIEEAALPWQDNYTALVLKCV